MKIITKKKEYSVKVKDVEFENKDEAFEMKYAAENYLEEHIAEEGLIYDVGWILAVLLILALGAIGVFIAYCVF